MSGMLREIRKFSCIAHLLAATAGLTLLLGACSGFAVKEQRKGQLGAAEQQQLNSSLRVASASADAGQLEAAERLYVQLSRHFPNAPEPRLGRAYLALEAGDFILAGKLFAEAEERSATPAARAEALLGAGRTGLGKGDTAGAKTHFAAASKLAKGTPAEAWVANGLGVVATLEGDHARARTRYEEALQLSPSHPMITANLVRALAQSGAENEARRLYAKYPASHWLDGDGAALSRFFDERKGAAAPSGAKVQLYSARSRDRALAAWGRLSSEEKDLLGSLSHRVVKARIPKKGVFYRLRAGPLADKAAAKRLCGLLKGRGRDCFVPAGKWTGGNGAGGEERPGTAEKNPDARAGGVRKIAVSPTPAAAKKPSSETPEAGEAAAAAGGAKVQLYSARSRDRALAAWGRLSSEEKDLLGSLTHRVVKGEIPKRGVFYRLRAGPLADKAAAKRLCGLLKGRGRDCFVPAGKW
ncbi:MAG: SPOR domain-containing protein [Deltaproteobacteria bacterium]|nr:SPOR domain-containing protein [Deltaproteobacteria bacterium]